MSKESLTAGETPTTVNLVIMIMRCIGRSASGRTVSETACIVISMHWIGMKLIEGIITIGSMVNGIELDLIALKLIALELIVLNMIEIIPTTTPDT